MCLSLKPFFPAYFPVDEPVEHAVVGDGVVNEVGVVDGLPHVHHPRLDREVHLARQARFQNLNVQQCVMLVKQSTRKFS